MADTAFHDDLVHQTIARRIAGGVSDMTFWRWRKAGVLPPPIVIAKRNYWRRSALMAALCGSSIAGANRLM